MIEVEMKYLVEALAFVRASIKEGECDMWSSSEDWNYDFHYDASEVEEGYPATVSLYKNSVKGDEIHTDTSDCFTFPV